MLQTVAQRETSTDFTWHANYTPNGIVYYSQDTHYSVPKALRLLKMQNIMVKSQSNGEIDYAELYESIKTRCDVPPIILANIGTTMKEAVDRVDRIHNIFTDLSIPSFYIHADAALSGMTLPFIEGSPPFNFTVGIDSISVSGHKFIGSPIPCGIVLAKKNNVDKVARSIEYIDSLDTTLPGSRNGITPLFLWYMIRKYGEVGFRLIVAEVIKCAEYAVTELNKAGFKVFRNPYAITIVLSKPPKSIIRKWHLAVNGEDAHIIIMPNVTFDIINEFVADMRENTACSPHTAETAQ